MYLLKLDPLSSQINIRSIVGNANNIYFHIPDKPQCLHSGPVTVALSEENKDANLVICDTEAVPKARSFRYVQVFQKNTP